MLTGNQPHALARRAEREPVYEAAANAIVEGEKGGAEEVADIVLARLKRQYAPKTARSGVADHS